MKFTFSFPTFSLSHAIYLRTIFHKHSSPSKLLITACLQRASDIGTGNHSLQSLTTLSKKVLKEDTAQLGDCLLDKRRSLPAGWIAGFFICSGGVSPLFQVNYRIAEGLYLFFSAADGSWKIPVAKFYLMWFQKEVLTSHFDFLKDVGESSEDWVVSSAREVVEKEFLFYEMVLLISFLIRMIFQLQ